MKKVAFVEKYCDDETKIMFTFSWQCLPVRPISASPIICQQETFVWGLKPRSINIHLAIRIVDAEANSFEWLS